MLAEDRAQSDTIATLLMTLIVIVSISTVGVALLSAQSEQIRNTQPPADFTTTQNNTSLTVTHIGGSPFPLEDLVLVLRQGDTEQRYNLSDPGDRLAADLDGDGTFESGESVTVSQSFTGEFRVVVLTRDDPGFVLYDERVTVSGSTSLTPVTPHIDQFDITDSSTNTDAVFDVTWRATDQQGDITQVTLELLRNGTVEDSVTRTFGGVADTGANTDTLTNASGSGEIYSIRLTVTDAAGNSVSESKADTADSDIGLRPPSVDTFEAVDVSSGSQVAYDYTYSVSDPDADLVTVKVELIKESTGVVVANVTDSYAQVATTNTQTGTLVDAAGSQSDGESYRVRITATDLEGNDVTASVVDVADGDGAASGSGSAPSIDQFSVTDNSAGTTASFDVTWRASDVDGDLANATLELRSRNGNTVHDTVTYTTTDFTSASDTGQITTTLTYTDKNAVGKNSEYQISLVVSDTDGKTGVKTEQHIADGDDVQSGNDKAP